MHLRRLTAVQILFSHSKGDSMRITSHAVIRIRQLLSEESEYVRMNDLVPIIVWVFNRSDEASNPGPTLGLIERNKISDPTDEYSEEGLLVYNGFPSELRAKFQNSILDFRDNNFDFMSE